MRMRTPIYAIALVLAALPAGLPAQTWAGPATGAGRSGFGAAVFVNDGIVYVGRPGEAAFFPMPANHTGTVHVFGRDAGGAWVENARIASESAIIGDGFGSVIAADAAVLAIGAPGQNGARGAVYIFERAAAGWRETARFTAAQPEAGDRLGSALAVSGDVILAGAPGRAGGRGSVHVFARSGGSWQARGVLAPDGLAEGDAFGAAIAADAGRALIGAPGPRVWLSLFGSTPPQAGSAWVFARDGAGTWRQEARLTQGGEAPASLGSAVVLAGDDAFVSAPLAGGATGAVVRFRRGPSGWAETGVIAPPARGNRNLYGVTLARAGADLLIGAPLRQGSGSVTVMRESDGQWRTVQNIDGDAPFAFLGGGLAADADLALVGVPGADFFEGAGLAYRRDPAGEWRFDARIITDAPVLDPITGGQECRDGRIAGFGCSDVDLLSFLPVNAVGGKRGTIVNDLWGWTDPETRREYAIVGRNNGTSFIDVTDAANPVFLGDLPLHAGATPNVWRDMKVFADHAFIVADGAGAHGVQVFDLRQLRNVRNAPAAFAETAHYDRIFSAHNIVINEQTGFAYVVGANGGGETCGGGLHMIDVRDPQKPRFAGCFADARTGNARTGYSHDAQCITYNGPDVAYRGREICFGANETALSIADVTDRQNPRPLATATYPNSAYLHQGWVSDDHRYLFMDDEGDELTGAAPRTRTLVWDIQDLDDPILVKEHLGTTAASDHNLYVRGHFLYESNYVSGLRILDIADPANPREIGFFDTVPWGEDSPGFAGSWSNYPFFDSGIIVVTSMREGVFILKQRPRPVS
jgi:choice-of-anchor B domain-containing protein